ncbi:MAG: 3-phosphoshikimate 1-carboxyvinyltransferase [Candidatus Omnitrophica bacterium]|nr:3-phosphoshikimate 1-carboxyvinyltransferase [Candidatus Omnitrophota bacterium]
MADFVVHPARGLSGRLHFPGDKSISHRSILLGAISKGTTRILHCLKSADVEASRRAVEELGVEVQDKDGAVLVQGKGLHGLKPPRQELDMGNSGTTTRLLMGILAGQPFSSTLKGDESLSRRPMKRVTEPLERMGAEIRGPKGGDLLPLTVKGGRLKGIRYVSPIPSAQVKSAVLLAGLYAQGPTSVKEPVLSRDHTERMLSFLGARLKRNSGTEVTVEPSDSLRGRELSVPADISSAAFFLVAASIVPGSSLTTCRIGLNPTRTGVLDLLTRMGARLVLSPDKKETGWEPVGEITASFGPLKAVVIEPQEIPRLIDELPILMVAATQAQGTTVIRGAGELRVKETDRIDSMVEGLSAMGARIHAEGDTVFIEGPVRLKGARVRSFSDHRTAMALAVAALTAGGPTVIEGFEWVNISFPDFPKLLEEVC